VQCQSTTHRARSLVEKGGWRRGGWGKTELHRHTFKGLGEFVRLPAGLVVATIAAMWGHWQTSTVAAERQIAEEMAKAACMVPSLFAPCVSSNCFLASATYLLLTHPNRGDSLWPAFAGRSPGGGL
jgi:hypothetical protein